MIGQRELIAEQRNDWVIAARGSVRDIREILGEVLARYGLPISVTNAQSSSLGSPPSASRNCRLEP
jgi:hypothetical protein